MQERAEQFKTAKDTRCDLACGLSLFLGEDVWANAGIPRRLVSAEASAIDREGENGGKP